MHVCLNTSTLHHPTYSDKPDIVRLYLRFHIHMHAGGEGRRQETMPRGKSRKSAVLLVASS
jgi:hypothetical protein